MIWKKACAVQTEGNRATSAPKTAATIQRTGEAFSGMDSAACSSTESSFPRRIMSFRY